MGDTLAATTHTAKATTRAAVNTSPEPFSNIGLSLVGDMAVPGMLWLAWNQPLWFFAALAVAVVAAVVVTWLLWRFLKALWRRFAGGPAAASA
jgi:membrane protein YdbS with pleckstrin-like domain